MFSPLKIALEAVFIDSAQDFVLRNTGVGMTIVCGFYRAGKVHYISGTGTWNEKKRRI